MNFDNYTKEKMTIDIVKANVFALVIFIPLIIIFGFPYYFIWGFDFAPKLFFVTVLLMIVGIVVHELIHGITWSLYCEKRWKSIHFGVLWKMLTPYCHCDEPLQKRHYVIGALMPLVILGLIPSILSLCIGNMGLLMFGIIFIDAACGDILVCWELRKERSDVYVLDHPSEAGCWVYRKDEAQ